jgi:hypothetical protein
VNLLGDAGVHSTVIPQLMSHWFWWQNMCHLQGHLVLVLFVDMHNKDVLVIDSNAQDALHFEVLAVREAALAQHGDRAGEEAAQVRLLLFKLLILVRHGAGKTQMTISSTARKTVPV